MDVENRDFETLLTNSRPAQDRLLSAIQLSGGGGFGFFRRMALWFFEQGVQVGRRQTEQERAA